MGRRPRIHYSGAIYHVYDRGVDRRPTFIDEQDYRSFVRTMTRITHETNTVILAYCLMPNHFHLEVKVSTIPLGRVIQRILTAYVKTFNARHGRTGHLFEGRHKAKICLTDRYVMQLIQYIQNNPVRANLVKTPEDWPWSSRASVSLPNLDDEKFNPWLNEPEAPLLIRRASAQALPISEIGTRISEETGIGVEYLQSATKARIVISAKVALAAECVRQGHSVKAIAEWLCCRPQAISYYLRKNSTN